MVTAGRNVYLDFSAASNCFGLCWTLRAELFGAMPPLNCGSLSEAEISEQLSGVFVLPYGSPLESLRRVRAPLGVTYSPQAAARFENGMSASRAVGFLRILAALRPWNVTGGFHYLRGPSQPCVFSLFAPCFAVFIA